MKTVRKSFRVRICLGVLLGIAGLALSIHWLLDREPVYRGRKVGAWLAVIARERIVEDEGEAFDALSGAGPEVVPYLMAKLKAEDSRFDAIYNTVLQKLPSVLQDRLPPFRDATYMRFKAESLLQIISQDGKQTAIPALLQLIKSPDMEVSEIAVSSLTRFETNAKPAIPVLLQYMTNSDWVLRQKARQILIAIGPEAKAAVPALVRIWQDQEKETEVREEALEVLKEIDGATWEKVSL